MYIITWQVGEKHYYLTEGFKAPSTDPSRRREFDTLDDAIFFADDARIPEDVDVNIIDSNGNSSPIF